MKKFYVNTNYLNDYERKNNRVSYKRVIDAYAPNRVLCNNIVNLDESVLYNASIDWEEDNDIYQYYICNLDEWARERLTDCGVLLSYSDELDNDVILVDHWGTSWDYVLTDVEPSEDLNACL